MPKLSSAVCLALFSSAAGLRKTVRSEANGTLEVANGCSAFSDVVVDGKNFGEGVELICNIWPSKFGSFPIEDIRRAKELLDKATGPGGTWEQIKEIRENRNSNNFCWRNETVRTVVSSDCEMESGGVCYGACPYGFKPGMLSGIFRPACTSACAASTNPVSCGFGCASSIGSCARTVLEQASAVASGVGAVTAFLTGNDRIAQVVDGIITFADFLLQTLPMLIDAVKTGIDIVKGPEEGAMVLILLFQYIKEVAPEIGETVESIKRAFLELADIFEDVIEEQRATGAVSVGKIVSAILDHGADVLDYALRVTRAFTYAKCGIATDVVFTVEEAGEEEFLGPYVQRGDSNGHPKYVSTADRSRVIEWNNRQDAWTFVDVGYLWDSYHYRSNMRSSEYPLSGWSRVAGSAPLPEIVAVHPRN